MKYKLLVIDVDGTLLNSNKEISKRTLYTLRNVQQTGVRIVIASGRPTYGLRSIARQLELNNYGGFILSYNGCQIIDAQTDTVIFERRINQELLPYLEKKSRKNGFAIFTYKEDAIITDTPDNSHIRSEAMLNQMKIVYEPEFSSVIDFSPCKCVLVSDDETALTSLEEHWKRRLNGSLDVFRSEPYFLEIVPPQIDKANTLGFLLKQLNIEKDEVIAIGDSVCDVTMIQTAGLGVAMGNALESVKRCADITTETNDNEGVALAAEKLILNEIHVSPDGAIADVFCSLTVAIEQNTSDFIRLLSVATDEHSTTYSDKWQEICRKIPEPEFAYSEMSAIATLIHHLPKDSILHLANSSTIRYAQLFKMPSSTTVCCNRGINGIEGSLSTAIGCASANPNQLNFIIIGDLSFFYDMNALWNSNYSSNVRILLLNNGSGEIFHSLPGLEMTTSSRGAITAVHTTSAKGWAEERGFEYICINDATALEQNIKSFTTNCASDKPILMEVCTDAAMDVKLLKDYYHQLKH